MLIPRSVLAELEVRLGSPGDGLRVVELEVEFDPLDLVRSGAAAFGFAGFFASPEGRVIGAIGAARRFASLGPDRLLAVDAPTRSLPSGVPLLVGFAFAEDGPSGADWEGFGAASVVVPEVTVIREGGRSRLVMVIPPGSDGRTMLTLLASLERPGIRGDAGEVVDQPVELPLPTDYIGLVDDAIAAIRLGSLSKVVLARSVLLRRSLPIDAFVLVGALRDAHPSSWVFGWQEGDGVFVGASPELLVARRGDHVHLSPLAGSASRSADPELDRRHGEALLASRKDRFEHEVVIADVLERLAPLVTGLRRPQTPLLCRFPSVQDLADVEGLSQATGSALGTIVLRI